MKQKNLIKDSHDLLAPLFELEKIKGKNYVIFLCLIFSFTFSVSNTRL